jgi:hypothetical protein
MANANKSPLAGGGAIVAPPNPISQLEITQGHGNFAAIIANMALVHGPRKIGQGPTICERFIFPIPPLEKIEAHMTGIDGQVKGLRVGAIKKSATFGDGTTGLIRPALRGRLGQPGGHGDGPSHHGQTDQPGTPTGTPGRPGGAIQLGLKDFAYPIHRGWGGVLSKPRTERWIRWAGRGARAVLQHADRARNSMDASFTSPP